MKQQIKIPWKEEEEWEEEIIPVFPHTDKAQNKNDLLRKCLNIYFKFTIKNQDCWMFKYLFFKSSGRLLSEEMTVILCCTLIIWSCMSCFGLLNAGQTLTSWSKSRRGWARWWGGWNTWYTRKGRESGLFSLKKEGYILLPSQTSNGWVERTQSQTLVGGPLWQN